MKSFQHVKLILLSIVGVLSFSGIVHGHTFTPNEDSSFLSLMDDLKEHHFIDKRKGGQRDFSNRIYRRCIFAS
jgi:hypothetical protein